MAFNFIVLAACASSILGSPISSGEDADPTSVNTEFFGYPSYTEFQGPTATGLAPLAVQTAYAYEDSHAPLYAYPVEDKNNKSVEFDYIRSFGEYSPWYSVKNTYTSGPEIPEGCNIVQWHLLHRHGARYPEDGSSNAGIQLQKKLANATESGKLKALNNSTKFLETWKNPLGSEILTTFGQYQEYTLGTNYQLKYGRLLSNVSKDEKMVFRTTSENRMLETSRYMAAGYFGLDFENQRNLVVQIEDNSHGYLTGINSTLAPWQTCPNNVADPIYDVSEDAKNDWIKVYLKDAVKRLSSQIKGITIDTKLLYLFQEMCAFETVTYGASAFCPLFTPEEHRGFSYSRDLSFWYSSSFGNPTSAAIGKGWTQEWLARVMEQPITEFNSTTNATLHTSKYFPLKQPIYVDATHDVIISAIITTLNFTSLRDNKALPTDHIPSDKVFDVTKISPFASNLQAQIMECPSLHLQQQQKDVVNLSTNSTTTNGTTNANNTTTNPTEGKFVRWVLNDAVVNITNIPGCEKMKDGLCYLPKFVDTISAYVKTIDFQHDCYANYTWTLNDTVFDGRPPKSSMALNHTLHNSTKNN